MAREWIHALSRMQEISIPSGDATLVTRSVRRIAMAYQPSTRWLIAAVDDCGDAETSAVCQRILQQEEASQSAAL